MRRRASFAPDPRKRAFDHPVFGWRLEPRVAMGDGDRGKFSGDRGVSIRQLEVRQIGRHGLWLGREGGRPPGGAPRLERGEIAGIAAPGAFGEGAFGVGACGGQRVGKRYVAEL